MYFLLCFNHTPSGVYKDDVGMTTQHKQILLSNVENLRRMNLDKVVQQLYLSGLLDDSDKQNLLTDTRLPSQRIDMLLTEILPRKGPEAFEDFAQELEKVHPSMARILLRDAGISGNNLSLHLSAAKYNNLSLCHLIIVNRGTGHETLQTSKAITKELQ